MGLLGFKAFVKCAAKTLKTHMHVHCYLQLKLFGKTTKCWCASWRCMQNDVTMHNEQVKKNRVALRRFIDAVCYLAIQELQFWGHDELFTSWDMASFIEFLIVLKNYDQLLENHLNLTSYSIWNTNSLFSWNLLF